MRVLRSIAGRWRGFRASLFLNPEAARQLREDRAGGYPVAASHEPHLLASIDWLCAAQDAVRGGGIARGYSLRWDPYFRRRGWQPPYPETTGYIIPTLLGAAAWLDRPELRERALRAAQWEIDVQLQSGAVQGGVIGEGLSPAVFNTGQVMLGWLASFEATGEARWREAALRAGQWLTDAVGPDGSFRHGNSQFARDDATIYNARVAWAMAEAAVAFDRPPMAAAARRVLDAAVRAQEDSGWFAACDLEDPDRPLLHTLSYTVRGLLEGSRVLGEPRYLEAAQRTARALADSVREDGWMPGRYGRGMVPAATWSCLTGEAQSANNWMRLAAMTGDQSWLRKVPAVLRFLESTQNRDIASPGVRGGIRGSWPVDGEYGTFEVLNWATKYFADALMRHLAMASPASRSLPALHRLA